MKLVTFWLQLGRSRWLEAAFDEDTLAREPALLDKARAELGDRADRNGAVLREVVFDISYRQVTDAFLTTREPEVDRA